MNNRQTIRVIRLAEAFRDHGKALYLVGGTVRDWLLRRESHDIDCATDARPEEIKAIVATTQPLHIVPIGEKYGTIQVHYPGDTVIEVTTYRGERYTAGSRHPEVQFGESLLEDLRRRDFTMNAVAKDALTRKMIDPFGGQQDIKDRKIRAVDNPHLRFVEDPLRMLRAVRLACQLDFVIDQATTVAILDCAYWIPTISQERMRDELCKILLSTYPEKGMCVLHSLGLTHYFLPELDALLGVSQLPHHSKDVFMHTMMVVESVPARLVVRLAALLHDIAKPLTRSVDEQGWHFYEHEDRGAEMARTILRRLRYGNDVVEQVASIVKLHMRVNSYTPQWSSGAVRRLYLDAGEVLVDLLDLSVADGSSDTGKTRVEEEARIGHLRSRIEQVQQEVAKQPLVCPLNGHELMEAFGRGPGPWLKAVKEHLCTQVVEGELQAGDKEHALLLARQYMNEVSS